MIDSIGADGTYPTISHRVAAGYRKFLVNVVPGAALAEEDQRARQDLHDFFQAFYENLYRQPDLFGLPLGEDDWIEEGEPHEKEKKQEVTARLKKPKEMMTHALDFLIGAGVQGRRVGECLVLDQGGDLVKQTRVRKRRAGGDV